MEGPDLMSIGHHCALPDCGQRDFLPFKCDCCGKVFCLEHRSVTSHACPNADARAGTTLVCPLCARAVKACDPSNYAKVMRKRKCPVAGCKEKLTSINSYTCRQCSESVCLRHRFPGDHNCAAEARKGRTPQQNSAVASLRRLFNFEPATAVARGQASQSAAARPESKQPNPTASAAGRPMPPSATSQPHQAQAAPRHGIGQEECPICRKTFDTLDALIAHSTTHEAESSRPEICPHCQASFIDAVSLVEHVERRHSRPTACVLS